jgi:hypothetical protein
VEIEKLQHRKARAGRRARAKHRPDQAAGGAT